MKHLRDLLEKTAGLRAPQTPCADAEDGRAQNEERRKVTSETLQKEEGLPSLQGRVKRELAQRLLLDDLDDPIHGPIERDLERYDQARVAAQQQAGKEAAREAFQRTWLRSTEKDL